MERNAKQKNRLTADNSGFTLIELIIIIAIMVILVGVMGANLIRYIERANVSSDTQLADTLRMAIITALADPAADGPQKHAFRLAHTASASITAPVPLDDASFAAVGSDNKFAENISLSLSIPSTEIASRMLGEVRSRNNSPELAVILTDNNVVVVITGTNRDGVLVTPAAGLTAKNIVVGAENALGPYR